MHGMRRWKRLALLGGLTVALGCASTGTTTGSDPQPDPRADASGRKAELAIEAAGAPALEAVYFDTDSPLLRLDARERLKRYAEAIRRHPEWGVITIEGHCDERGSEEYNLALGEKRAAAVARYLIDLGVPADRLARKTYGEARPAAQGSDERAWNLNRRAELEKGKRDSAMR